MIGTTLGHYQVLEKLGEGGMGEVYRARDTVLGRDVAIKALPDPFALDPERIARFGREAQVLAALNHPHIAAIHGLEQVGPSRYLVLEFVDGQSLAERLTSGPLPFSEAIAIARQIIDALEAAHDKGIVHRDIKPANIMLTADGEVKVLDFGLARVAESGHDGDASNSPTLTAAATGMGVILGTAAYMAPEQAKGRIADARSDVWAFGCVLYEMLAGKRVFEGEDVSETLAAVLRADADWSALPPDAPPATATLLKRCLERDRKKRIPAIATVRFLLEDTLAAPVTTAAAPGAVAMPNRPWWRRMLPIAIAAVLAAVATGLTAWLLVRARLAVRAQPVRFSIFPAPTEPFALPNDRLLGDRIVAVSPDGTHVVYVSERGPALGGPLILRSIDRLDAQPLRGITSARGPFFSPDGKWVGFFEGNEELKKVPITGGSPTLVCKVNGPSRGAAWGPDGTIVFATNNSATGLQIVPAAGGTPQPLTNLDRSQQYSGHRSPSFLPGGHAILFTIVKAGTSGTESQAAVLDLQSRQTKMLMRGAQPEYVPAPEGGPGYLLYAADAAMHAVRFDPRRYEVLGDPVRVLDGLRTGDGIAQYASSRSGTLVSVSGAGTVDVGGAATRSLVWIDRQGHEEPIEAPQRAYVSVRLSPDGKRLALDARDQENDIWIWDLARKVPTKVTFGPALDSFPIWTRDSLRIVFSSSREGTGMALYSQTADGTGSAERLIAAGGNAQFLYANSFARDDALIVSEQRGEGTSWDISLLSLDGNSQPAPIIRTPSAERNAEVSPDGHWIAYQSTQIYVRPFPNVESGRWQVSTSGGSKPMWAPNGRELLFIDGKDMLTSVPVQTSPVFVHGNPTQLFEIKSISIGVAQSRHYDISPDGKRFVVIKDMLAPGGAQSAPPSLTVVLNLQEELRQRVPVK
jgi:serine/threonine-protein kinase